MGDFEKKLIMKRYSSIFESKQVGILYHFTPLRGLAGIIKDNLILKPSIETKQVFLQDSDEKIEYVSFTRKFDFGATEIRLDIDGDILSRKYKIEQYSYTRTPIFRHKEPEAEERIKGSVAISSALLSVTILSKEPIQGRVLPIKIPYNAKEIAKKRSIFPDDVDNYVEMALRLRLGGFYKNYLNFLEKKNIPIFLLDETTTGWKSYKWCATNLS